MIFLNDGFSLRESLYLQGVTVESVLRGHLAFVYNMTQIDPLIDIRRYRVSKTDPNHPTYGIETI